MQVRRNPLLLILLSIITTAASAQITQLAELMASDATANGYFGSSIAMARGGGTVAVSGWSSQSQAVYVFVGSGGNWTQVAELADGVTSRGLGYAPVAISADGSVIVVGASAAGSSNQGAAYVFVEPPYIYWRAGRCVSESAHSR